MNQAYQQASDYRKSLEKQYEQTVNMDSWGMSLMDESAWLKNSAAEDMYGRTAQGKAADDTLFMKEGSFCLPL